MTKRFFIAMALPLFCGSLSAQDNPDTLAAGVSEGTLVSIRTNIEGARVSLNSDSVGLTPLTLHSVPSGTHHLRIVSPDAENWLNDPIVDTNHVQAGTSQTLFYSFSQKFLVVSTPSGAEVVLADSIVGTTPLVLKTEQQTLKLRKQGFEETDIDISEAKRGILSAQLKKLWQSDTEESILTDSEHGRSSLRLYITGATTILAGAASAYFKVKADNSYSQYVRTGDPGQLSEVNRLDAAAGISLAATQISLGLFTYFILSE